MTIYDFTASASYEGLNSSSTQSAGELELLSDSRNVVHANCPGS